MRRAAKVDANQPAIVQAFRQCGFSVYPAHRTGEGFPDLVIAFGGLTWLVEVKDGSKPPSARMLTEPQQRFHESWKAPIAVIASIDQALDFATRAKQEAHALHQWRIKNGLEGIGGA